MDEVKVSERKTLVDIFLDLYEALPDFERQLEFARATQYKAKNEVEAQGLFILLETFREAEFKTVPMGA